MSANEQIRFPLHSYRLSITHDPVTIMLMMVFHSFPTIRDTETEVNQKSFLISIEKEWKWEIKLFIYFILF